MNYEIQLRQQRSAEKESMVMYTSNEEEKGKKSIR